MNLPAPEFFASAEALADKVASLWLDEIVLAQRAGRPHTVALSGGRITLKLFASVIKAVRQRRLDLAGVEFFWADERCVPPADAESNFGIADLQFLKPLAIASDKVHRIRGDEPPETAAREGEAELCRLAELNAAGQPVLDLIFLGMGEDGHVASLFPGESAAISANPATYRVVENSPKPPPTRITLGYGAIAAAKQVWVLATGSGKESALRESLNSDSRTPLGRVLASHCRSRVFTDIRIG